MRVTHVITRLIVGGAQENTIASVLGLRKKPGIEVSLVSGKSPGREGSLEMLVNAEPGLLSIIPSLVRPINLLLDIKAGRQLFRLFRETQPLIVHTHSGKAGVLGRLAAARAGVPIIIHTIHGPSFGNFQGSLANWAFRRAELRAGKVTSHFVTVANAMRDQYLAAGIGRSDQYTRIFSGFPLKSYLESTNDPALRARYGIGPTDIVVGKIARLFKLKGHEDLFKAATAIIKENPRIKFLLVGDGPWRTKFEGMVKSAGLENNVIFTGLVPPEQVPHLLGIMDFLVHLSLREGLARALPQALAAGKPVIVYDCDGAKEVCLDNKTGFLIQPGDLNTLVDRIKLLSSDQMLRERLGREGREFVRDRFPVERMVDDLYSLYERLAHQAGLQEHR